MSEQLNFKEVMLPFLKIAASSAIRVVGVALVARGIVDQKTVESISSGLTEVIIGGALYGASHLWSQISTRKDVAIEVKKDVSQQVAANAEVAKVIIQNEVKQEVKEQIAKNE